MKKKSVEDKINDVVEKLKSAGIKAKADFRDNYSVGYKYNHWELKGVPIRLELGPRDLSNQQSLMVRRDNGAKEPIPLVDIVSRISNTLKIIQKDMFDRAKKVYDEHVKIVLNWDDFVPTLDGKNVVLIPWCEEEKCEDSIKEKSTRNTTEEAEDEKAPSMGAKSLCIPLEQPDNPPIIPGETKCVSCGALAKKYALFGRSY